MIFDEDSEAWALLADRVRTTLRGYWPDEEPDAEALEQLCTQEALLKADFTLHGMSLVLHYPASLLYEGKKTLMEINNLAMMFVPVAVIIPRYLLIDKMGMINTYAAHILPLIAMPVGMFLVKQFTDQVPDSLIEAAIVDGAGYFRVFFKIILPLVRPAIATVAILAFQSVWNNTETSIMFTNRENMRTLTFYMNTLASNTNAVAGQGIAAAASLIMFLPNLILFICMQSKVMNTMAYSGMK